MSHQMFLLCCIRREKKSCMKKKNQQNQKIKKIRKFKDLLLISYVEILPIKTAGIGCST